MYITKDNTSAFLINYKVCYSTFEHLKSQDILYTNDNIHDKIFQDIPIYYIVRNPINRIVSFYKDKIINEIKKNGLFNQDCTTDLLKFYKKDFIMSDEFNINHLLIAIENGYRDSHVNPQIELYKIVSRVHQNINIIKMEDSDFDNKICNLLKIDILPKCNNTNSISNIKLNINQIKRIKKIYYYDFILFKYIKRQN